MDRVVQCPHCCRRYRIEADTADTPVRCKACGTTFRIPEPPAPPVARPIPGRKAGVLAPPKRKPPKRKRRRRPIGLEFMGMMMITSPWLGRLTHPGEPVGPYTWTFDLFVTVVGLTLLFGGALRRRTLLAVLLADMVFVAACATFMFRAGRPGNGLPAGTSTTCGPCSCELPPTANSIPRIPIRTSGSEHPLENRSRLSAATAQE